MKIWLGNLPDHHPDNLWQMYVTMLAEEKNMSNCYVCSVMPKSTRQPTLYAKSMPAGDGTCFLRTALVPVFAPGYIKNRTACIRSLNGSHCDVKLFSTCNNTTRIFPFTKEVRNYIGSLKAQVDRGDKHPVCIQSPFKPSNKKLGQVQGCQANLTDLFPNSTLTRDYVAWASIPTEGGWFLCGGNNIYPSLPLSWSGTCAPVFVSDHTVIISAQAVKDHHSSDRMKRELSSSSVFKPHDPIWGSNVPSEHKHWSTANKIGLSLFPWFGVGKSMLMIETLDYRMKTLVNMTMDINKGQNKQLSEMRLMVLQNRMVLDMLTASQGGVCVMIGISCCTYISDANETHITEVMSALKNLQQAMSQDAVPLSVDFLPWFFSGS